MHRLTTQEIVDITDTRSILYKGKFLYCTGTFRLAGYDNATASFIYDIAVLFDILNRENTIDNPAINLARISHEHCVYFVFFINSLALGGT